MKRSAIASALGSISTPRKASAARRNGAMGGRPSSGCCTERELRRRLRASGMPCNQEALAFRRDLVARFQSGRLTVDGVVRAILKRAETDSWAHLVQECPTML